MDKKKALKSLNVYEIKHKLYTHNLDRKIIIGD